MDTALRMSEGRSMTQTMAPAHPKTYMIENVQFWCHSCKVPFSVSWEELDRIRASGQSTRVLCRCKRWIGNISVIERPSSVMDKPML